MKRNLRMAFFGLAGCVLILSFQNCAQNGMQFKESSQKTTSNDVSGVPDGGGVTPPVVVPPTVVPPVMPPVEEPYVPSEAPPFACKQFQIITPGEFSTGNLDIPARDDRGICYIVHLLNEVKSVSSLSGGFTQDTDVISRHHGAASEGGVLPLHNPFLMGKSEFNVRLRGIRKILLSGGPNDQDKILVDNFILVGIQRDGAAADYPNQYLAYGSSDSSISVDSPPHLAFRGMMIELLPFATGGVSTIAPLALENKIGLNHFYKFDIRALDAGSVARMSDLYLLFQ